MLFTDLPLKRCGRCRVVKSDTEFHRRAKSKDGLHRVCKPCNYALSKEWRSHHPDARRGKYAANPDPYRDRQLRRHYGITLVEYKEMLAKQDGGCAVCFAPPTEKRTLDVDHNHQTGEIRGLLCMRCNLAIGHLLESPVRAFVLAVYLLEHTR